MPRYATIAATGSYLPEIEVTNDALRQRFGGSVGTIDKLEESTGIRKRWYAPESWSTSDLALPAARRALEAAGLAATDLDLIILGTDTPDFISPATSTVLQHKLGAVNAGTFDVGCACASFPTGLAAASGLIASNASLKAVLVVGVYMMHKLADENDPLIFLYGDGAGAAVLVPSEKPGFLASAFSADGSFSRRWGIFAGGTVEPASEESVRAGRTRVRMAERYPPEVNHEGWPRLVRQLASQDGFGVPDIDLVIFSQVRKPSIELVMGELGLGMDRTHTIMEEQGYTGSACLAMALHDARTKGKAGPGSLVVLVGSGVGYNQAGVAFRMPEKA